MTIQPSSKHVRSVSSQIKASSKLKLLIIMLILRGTFYVPILEDKKVSAVENPRALESQNPFSAVKVL